MFNWDTDAKIITNRQLRICANKTVHQLGTVKLHEGSLTALVAAAVFISGYDDLSRTDWSAPAG